MISLMILPVNVAMTTIGTRNIAAMVAPQVAPFLVDTKRSTHRLRTARILVAILPKLAESRAIWAMNKAKCWQFHKIGR